MHRLFELNYTDIAVRCHDFKLTPHAIILPGAHIRLTLCFDERAWALASTKIPLAAMDVPVCILHLALSVRDTVL
jgi:hypothetical protein